MVVAEYGATTRNRNITFALWYLFGTCEVVQSRKKVFFNAFYGSKVDSPKNSQEPLRIRAGFYDTTIMPDIVLELCDETFKDVSRPD